MITSHELQPMDRFTLGQHSTAELEAALIWRKVRAATLTIIQAEITLATLRRKQEARLRQLARLGARIEAERKGAA